MFSFYYFINHFENNFQKQPKREPNWYTPFNVFCRQIFPKCKRVCMFVHIILKWKLDVLLFYFEMVLYFIIMRTFWKIRKRVCIWWVFCMFSFYLSAKLFKNKIQKQPNWEPNWQISFNVFCRHFFPNVKGCLMGTFLTWYNILLKTLKGV